MDNSLGGLFTTGYTFLAEHVSLLRKRLYSWLSHPVSRPVPNNRRFTARRRYGYGYLIEPMMKSGGYVAASERMGIALNNRTLKDNEYYERINPTVGLDIKKKADKDGFLTLGRYFSVQLE